MIKNRIPLPDGGSMERLYDRALIMENSYQERYEELLMNNTKEGVVLVYIHSNMDKTGVLVSDLDTIAKVLGCSRTRISRAVSLLKERYSDLVRVEKYRNTSKFVVDTARCFKA